MKALAMAMLVSCAASARAAAPAAPAAAPPLVWIGNAAGVMGQVKAVDRAEIGRVVVGGQPVYLGDKVVTDAESQLQIILRDETVFTIGPNSAIVIDQFVYDEATGAGEISANILQGVFRFITGKISGRNPGKMKVHLPLGTIGVFGTIVAGRTTEHDAVVVLMGPGEDADGRDKVGRITVESLGKSVAITRADFATRLVRGKAPSAPFRAPLELIDSLSQTVSSRPALDSLTARRDAPARRSPDARAQARARSLARAERLASDASLFAAQQAATGLLFPSGQMSNWDAVRTLQGTGVWLNSSGGTTMAAPFIGGGVCAGGSANCTGSWSYALGANFSTRVINVLNARIVTPNINTVPFSTSFNYTNSMGPAGFTVGNGAVGAYTFQLGNANNQPAGQVVGTVVFNNGVNSGSGLPAVGERP